MAICTATLLFNDTLSALHRVSHFWRKKKKKEEEGAEQNPMVRKNGIITAEKHFKKIENSRNILTNQIENNNKKNIAMGTKVQITARYVHITDS